MAKHRGLAARLEERSGRLLHLPEAERLTEGAEILDQVLDECGRLQAVALTVRAALELRARPEE